MMAFLCNRVCKNKTEYGYCKTCYCINPLFSNIGTAQYEQCVQKSIVTNADLIRAKNDEELAKWICELGVDCAYCKITSMCYEVCKNGDCEKAWLEWLKQEVDS